MMPRIGGWFSYNDLCSTLIWRVPYYYFIIFNDCLLIEPKFLGVGKNYEDLVIEGEGSGRYFS